MFFECLNVYFFSETASRFRLPIHQQIKDEFSNKKSVLRILEANGRQIEFVTKTKIEKGTPFKRYIQKAIEQTSKFTEGHAKSRKQKLPVACLRQLFRLILRLIS